MRSLLPVFLHRRQRRGELLGRRLCVGVCVLGSASLILGARSSQTSFAVTPALKASAGTQSSAGCLGFQSLTPYRSKVSRHAASSTPDAEPDQSTVNGIFLMSLVTLLFGSNQVLIKTLETDDATAGAIDCYLCMSLRFGIAAVALLIPTIASSRSAPAEASGAESRSFSASFFTSGLELSIWLFFGYLLQAVGLQYTTASSGALLGSLTMVLVPVLSALDGRKVEVSTWFSVGLAVIGTFLFVGPDKLSGTLGLGGLGDLCELASAALFAVQLWRCEKLIRQVPEHEVAPLTCLQLTLIAIFAFACMLVHNPDISSIYAEVAAFPQEEWIQVAVMGLVTTAFCLWAEASALRSIDASLAAIIYACEPLWGSLFAYLWRGEILDGPWALSGAALLCLAALSGAVAGAQGQKAEQISA